MDSMSIALSALRAAQMGLNITGNNIANAATEGYHKQRIEFTPAFSNELNGMLIGGGVDVAGINRIIDGILEKQLTRQYSLAGQARTELDTLSTVEAAFGELGSGGGTSTLIDNFFNALSSLSSDPSAAYLQTQVITAANALTSQFRTVGTMLADLSNAIVTKSYAVTKQINEYAEQIAELNYQIREINLKGGSANNMMDERDARINKLAELVGVTSIQRDDGTVDVGIGGSWLVVGSSVQKMNVAVQENGLLGIAPVGTTTYSTEVEGGSLGAYFSLNNTTLSGIIKDFDTLAQSLITSVNRYHVQGIGSSGPFTELVGISTAGTTLSDLKLPVTDGQIFVRVTDTATGQTTRTAVSISGATDTMTTAAAKLDAVAGVSAWIESGRLHIKADTGCTFDFLPSVISPAAGTLAGSSDATLSGIYSGTDNDNWTFTVVGSGEVGNSDNLSVRITDKNGNQVGSVNIGTGYTAGNSIEIASGIKIAFASGTVVDGDSFSADILAQTDTSGLLSAAGINTFFTGSNACDIALSGFVSAQPANIAACLGADLSDNANVLRLSRLNSEKLETLGNLTVGGYYQQLVTDIGTELSVKQLRIDNIETVTQNLKSQREATSGVDVNDEAAKMLVFERMFQASARYLNTVQSTMDEIMRLL